MLPNPRCILSCETDDPEDYDKYTIHVALNLAFACSLRDGELAVLQWSDFDTQYSFKVTKSIPNYSPFAKSCIVLKNTKTEGSVRKSYFNETVKKKLDTLREMQNNLKEMLGEGYFDYGLVICQAHGRPLMTEHLNRKFKNILEAAGMKEVVFHSLRSTSTQFKLRMSNGVKVVQGENGHADSKSVLACAVQYLYKSTMFISKQHNFSLKMQRSPVLLGFFAIPHCINNEV